MVRRFRMTGVATGDADISLLIKTTEQAASKTPRVARARLSRRWRRAANIVVVWRHQAVLHDVV